MTEKEKQRIIELRNNGLGYGAIAVELGISKNVVSSFCHRYNVDVSRAPNHDKKYGNNWRRIRALYVKQHPLCERCLKEGRITPVEEVHHIVPLSRGGTNQFSSLMSLCQSCHTKTHYELGDRK